MPMTDSEILSRIRGGAKHLFAQIVDRYKDKGMSLAVRMLKSREEAEEALQDAFIRAYNALERFEETSTFGTWFYRILYNVCLTRLGKRKDEFQSVDYDDEQSYWESDNINTTAADVAYEKKELVDVVKTIIEAMPAKYAVILTMFYLHEMSHEEICAVTQLPVGTVKTHLFRARALLQKRLAKNFQVEGVEV